MRKTGWVRACSLHSTGTEIEGVLSVVLPSSLQTGDLETIKSATFRYATHYLGSKGASIRWPTEGHWLEGDVDDLAEPSNTCLSRNGNWR